MRAPSFSPRPVQCIVLAFVPACGGRHDHPLSSGRAASGVIRPSWFASTHRLAPTILPFAARVTAGNPPRSLIVEKIPSISEHDIASFYPYKAADGTFAVAFQLDLHMGPPCLEALSAQNRGRYILAAVNAHPVALLAIDKRISDGIIYIPSGLTLEEIHKLGESFSLMGQTDADKAGQESSEGDHVLRCKRANRSRRRALNRAWWRYSKGSS